MFDKTYVLHYSSIFDERPDKVCAFHTDTRNLHLITPKWIDVKILFMDMPMRENSIVGLEIKRFGISTVWNMKIAKLQCPQSVIDEMVSGPFSTFRHERHFSSIDEGQTQMDETITLSLPFGFIGGSIFRLIKKDMDTMFSYRHQATKRYFEENHRS